ncbi:hypothetical protein BDW74DRAFT_166668 [Aspergillus multicolor]|uniref:Zn(II)2Cys6 transcription factor n=1 Tax=Aspergillus multicolor TaxID=41759 RepID=UPI003CCD9A1B
MPTTSQSGRGCFQCTKRRIICDRGEPTCRKCQKKGIECSGLGRIRFYAGGSIRGYPAPTPVTPPEPLQRPQSDCAAKHVPFNVRWKADRPSTARRRRSVRAGATAVRTAKLTDEDLGGGSGNDEEYAPPAPPDNTTPVRNIGAEGNDADDSIEKVGQATTASASSTITPWIPPLAPQTRMFLSHFADEVAPIMVILDKIANGYREIILPLACHDELLQQSVCAVAAQHLALRQPSFRPFAESGRAAIISRLRQDAFREPTERLFSAFTWATLIVLLVGETITASPEYTHLLHLLSCMAGNTSDTGIPMSSVNQFLTQQTHMFQLLGQPFLDETQGLDILRLPHPFLDWTYYDLPAKSAHTESLALVREAFVRASHIYIGRATATQNENADQIIQLEALKRHVSRIPPDHQVAHALVWVCFIGAADSTDPEHRRFFTSRMEGVFRRTGFQNVAAALRSLPNIWAQKDSASARWTSSLIRTLPALIM